MSRLVPFHRPRLLIGFAKPRSNPASRLIRVLTRNASPVVLLTGLFVLPAARSVAQMEVPPAPQRGTDNHDRFPDKGTISVDVVVRDKSGKPVSGLQPSDFSLTENKQPKTLTAFAAFDAQHPAPGPVRVLLLIDAINQDYLVVARERDGVLDYLRQNSGRLAYATSIALATQWGVKAQDGPSQDGKALLATLQSTPAEFRPVSQTAAVYGAAERSEMSFNLIRDLADREAQFPERKLVLFLSSGWPMLSEAGSYIDAKHRSWAFDDIVHMTNTLREGRVALYTLDPESGGGRSSHAFESFLKPPTKPSQAQYPQMALQVLSEHSGGEVLTEGNDVRRQIETAVQDAQTWYRLTFASAPAGQTVEYHALRVTIDKPGLVVRTTAGYYTKP